MKRSVHGGAGFTLIELLIVITVIGVLAAIAIPNLVNALHRGKQKATMADLHSIAEAMEFYNVDHGHYPTTTSSAQMEAILEPIYIRECPPVDGWRNPWLVSTNAGAYTVASGGRDGGAINYVGETTHSLNDAIIFSNGRFIQAPYGYQE